MTGDAARGPLAGAPSTGPGERSVAEHVVACLTRAGLTLAVAESLTGGAVLDALVGVPGASAALRGGVVAYATDLKRDLLGVDADLLAARGPVDAAVALAMADGVRRLAAADVGLATTGVAGPDPQGDRPVGEFHVAVTGTVAGAPVRVVRSVAGRGAPTRADVRAAARDLALDLLLDALGGTERGGAALDRT